MANVFYMIICQAHSAISTAAVGWSNIWIRPYALAAAQAPAPVVAAADLPAGTILNLDKTFLYNIAIQLFNVAVLIVALTFILYKPVKKYLTDRRQRISDELANARHIRDEAEQLRNKYEAMLKGIDAERDEVLARANKIAIEKSDQMLFEAKHEAEAMHNRAKTDIEMEYRNMENGIKRQIIEIAHQMAGHFVEMSIDRETQDKLIEYVLSEYDSSGSDDSNA